MVTQYKVACYYLLFNGVLCVAKQRLGQVGRGRLLISKGATVGLCSKAGLPSELTFSPDLVCTRDRFGAHPVLQSRNSTAEDSMFLTEQQFLRQGSGDSAAACSTGRIPGGVHCLQMGASSCGGVLMVRTRGRLVGHGHWCEDMATSSTKYGRVVLLAQRKTSGA